MPCKSDGETVKRETVCARQLRICRKPKLDEVDGESDANESSDVTRSSTDDEIIASESSDDLASLAGDPATDGETQESPESDNNQMDVVGVHAITVVDPSSGCESMLTRSRAKNSRDGRFSGVDDPDSERESLQQSMTRDELKAQAQLKNEHRIMRRCSERGGILHVIAQNRHHATQTMEKTSARTTTSRKRQADEMTWLQPNPVTMTSQSPMENLQQKERVNRVREGILTGTPEFARVFVKREPNEVANDGECKNHSASRRDAIRNHCSMPQSDANLTGGVDSELNLQAVRDATQRATDISASETRDGDVDNREPLEDEFSLSQKIKRARINLICYEVRQIWQIIREIDSYAESADIDTCEMSDIISQSRNDTATHRATRPITEPRADYKCDIFKRRGDSRPRAIHARRNYQPC